MELKTVLIVDDNKTILSILESKLNACCKINILKASSYKEGVSCIKENEGQIHAAIIDLNLPDAHDGQMADYSMNQGIPTVILTGIFDEKLKERLLEHEVLDYIQKDSKKGLNNSISSVHRILNNYDTTVLIVDDSNMLLKILKKILVSIKLNVLTASDGKEALEIIEKKGDEISLLLTDYIMPNMDGFELTMAVRDIYDKDELGIVVLSSSKDDDTATNFIKIGANDYLDKPYKKTAVVTRVNSVLHTLDLFKQAKDMSYKDYMTGAYNRRYFYSSGEAIYTKAKRENRDLAIVSLDIDNFKNINDTYGHDVGDLCIIKVVELLNHNLRSSDLLARFGGEEFIILLEKITIEDLEKVFEKIRRKFEENKIASGDDKIEFTVSMGIYYGMQESIDKMIKIADEALYYSKNNGRNQVCIKE